MTEEITRKQEHFGLVMNRGLNYVTKLRKFSFSQRHVNVNLRDKETAEHGGKRQMTNYSLTFIK